MTLLTLHASLMVIDTLFGYVVGNINAPNALQYQPIVNNDQYSNTVILRGPNTCTISSQQSSGIISDV